MVSAPLLIELDAADMALEVDARVGDEDAEKGAAAAALALDLMVIVERVLRLELWADEAYSAAEE